MKAYLEIHVTDCDNGRNVKCPRCWHWHGVVENFGHLPDEIAARPELAKEKLCDRCQSTILECWPDHPASPHIRSALAEQRRKYTAEVKP